METLSLLVVLIYINIYLGRHKNLSVFMVFCDKMSNFAPKFQFKVEQTMKIKADYANAPQWKEMIVKSSLPQELKCLDEIAHNLWWVWNYEARDLFRDLDPELYHDVKHNPVMLLERLSFDRKEAIVNDKALMKRIKNVYQLFRNYMDVEPDSKRPTVAYSPWSTACTLP